MASNHPISNNSTLNNNIISWQEYSKHITPQDCWVLIDQYLYDVSDYLVQHPGGDDILLKYSGIDATQPFKDQQHSSYAVSLRDAKKIGKIQTPIYTQQYRLMLQQKKKKLKQVRKSGQKKHKTIRDNISMEEVSRHNNQKSCWIIIQNNIYDVTDYMVSHPGGQGLILEKGGKDATLAFKQAKHSMDAIQKRGQFYIGNIKSSSNNISNLLVIVALIILMVVMGWFFYGIQSQ